MLKDKLRMNLQYFADNPEGDNPDGDGADQNTKKDDDKKDNKELTLSQSELDSRVNKAVQTALSNAQSKWEKEKEEAIRKAKEEGQSYAQMTEKQRQEAKEKKEREDFEKEKAEFKKERLTLEVEKDLSEKGLPTSFAQSLVLLDDKEKIAESVNNLKSDFDKAVNEAVKVELRQDAPKGDGGVSGSNKVNPFAQKRNEEKKQETKGPNPWG